MEKLILLFALFVLSVFAQEEEIQIELESDGSPVVDSTNTAGSNRAYQLPGLKKYFEL